MKFWMKYCMLVFEEPRGISFIKSHVGLGIYGGHHKKYRGGGVRNQTSEVN